MFKLHLPGVVHIVLFALISKNWNIVEIFDFDSDDNPSLVFGGSLDIISL
jgi:hypothetical protein